MTSAQMSDLRIKPDFVVEHQRGYKKTLQRRLQMPDEGHGLLGSDGAVEGGMRATLRGSPTIVTKEELEDVTHFPEKFNAVQSGASWEGKLLRLIVQKCEEHSGRAVSMRETFLRLDKDKVGWVSKEDLREVLQNYTGMTLSNRCANAISLCPLFRACVCLPLLRSPWAHWSESRACTVPSLYMEGPQRALSEAELCARSKQGHGCGREQVLWGRR